MTGGLMLCAAFVVNILVLVACTETTYVVTKNVSSASETSTMMTTTSKTSYASLSSSTKTVKSRPKCRRVKKCPKNEEFSFSPESIQRAQYCSKKAEPSTYRTTSSKLCEGGCVCKENYLRAENGTCIPAAQCPVTCGANEILVNCPTDCQSDYCPTGANKEAILCVRPDVCPPPACKCAFNHRRASNGSCIPTRECPPYACGTNEEYNPCPPLCPTDDCSQASPSGKCPQLGRIGIILPCNPKCRCIKDYWRLDGICVPYGQCPGVCPANERYSTCRQAECRALNCTQKDKPVPCVRMDPKYCKKECVCKEGYLRNDGGICVLKDKCEPVCPDNERYSTCTQAECRALNCTQKGQSVPCIDIDPQYCKKGCVCKEGYLRNKDGFCVLEDKCETAPSCTSANEEFVTCMQGVCRAKDCSQKGEDVPCPDIPQERCDSGCICKEHFLRAANGSCVPEDQCESNPCQPNEEFSNCIQAICRTLNCSDKGIPRPCPMVVEKDCKKGCVCREGYLRTEDGCIPEDKCNPNKCPLFEVWDNCANAACRAEYCTQKGLPVPCPSVMKCLPGCLCRPDYLRNADGFCVPEDDCNTGLCPTNEVYSSCVQQTCRQQNCSDRDVAMKSCPSCDEASCQRGCVCQENYYRNDKGVCVPYKECEAPNICGENEVLDNCPRACTSDNCPQSADEKQVCTEADPCVPACKCRFNHKRAENGTCIPTSDCPPFDCSAKPNEEFVACPPLCPTDECGKPRLEGRCPFRIGILLICNPKCQCKDGYGRVNGTCVPFEQCPGLCPTNEVYSSCVQQTCRQQKCADRDLVMETCPSCDKPSCQRGCVCQKNYYRNDKGVCVSYEQCGGPMCPNAHEEYKPDFKECPPNTCNALVAKKKCDENQKEGPGCVCESGYLRINVTSPCIPICDCPEMKHSADCNN